MTKAVILAGGLGTRLAEETVTKPKPMVEIGGKPILWHIMKFYAAHGVKEFIICAGYKQEYIKSFFANYYLNGSDTTFDLSNGNVKTHNSEAIDWKVSVINTGDTTQTGGRLKRVRDYLGNEPFFMTYGDGLSNVDVTAALAAHKKSDCLVTLSAVFSPPRFGELDIQDGKVVSFMEKLAQSARRINGGFMVVDPKALDYVADDSTSWEQQPMRQMAAEGKVHAFEHDGFWQCMDNIREREYLDELWASGKAPWKIWS